MAKDKKVYVVLHSGVIIRVGDKSPERKFVPKDCKSFDHFPNEEEYFGAYPAGAPLPLAIPEKENN